MNVDAVTARYVGALFELAEEQGALDEVRSDVDQLAEALQDPVLSGYLVDARVDVDEKRAKFMEATKAFHVLTANFVQLLFDKHREAVMVGMGAAFRQRFLESRGAVEGVVQSARALGSDELGELREALGKLLKKDVLLSNTVEPDLVGGVRILVDNRLLDQSVRGRLAGLRRTLLETRIAPAGRA